ncbi:NIPSNAP family protein [Labedaea rhizosphaerae]|uniref:NIPSNAP protein n=1 Tax=Labedaea rhizosphaerae TaxID=598644 RepID=A0A4V3CYG3_LABRH|nr:NIPSNAP family protein [Labedaea rhizosphaerae]TDP94058.1 NIPSNAP protein [Labedaea rhizosphaerae]
MADAQLLELRLFTVKPGMREEFDRVSREGTVPLMRKIGITVVAHGPSLYDEDTYYLLRAFDDEKQRTELGASLYEQPEWEQYDEPVGAMMAAYSTVVFPMSTEAIKHMAEFGA